MGRKGAAVLRLPRPRAEGSRRDGFAALQLSQVGGIWNSAFSRKMRVPHPLVGTLNSPVQPLQNALAAGGWGERCKKAVKEIPVLWDGGVRKIRIILDWRKNLFMFFMKWGVGEMMSFVSNGITAITLLSLGYRSHGGKGGKRSLIPWNLCLSLSRQFQFTPEISGG